MLGAMEDPRFHCSRCDHLFICQDEVSLDLPEERVQPFEIGSPAGIETPSRGVEVQQPPLARPFIQEPAMTDILSGPVSSTPQPARSLEIPRAADRSWTISAPHETVIIPAQEVSTITEREQPQLPFSFGTPTAASAQPSPQITRKPASQNHETPSRFSSTDPAPGDFGARNPIVALPAHQVLNARLQSMRRSLQRVYRNGPLTLLLPIAAFALCLCTIALFFRASPARAHSITRSLIPSLPRFAPPGMALDQLQFKRVALDSGDTVYAVSGRVRNSSGEDLRSVEIETIVFNGRNEPIATKRSPAGSLLSQSKLRSLTLETIEDIQAQASRKTLALKDGEELPFTMVFSRREVKGLRNFSARVYSVRN